jgi:hypothetical protein
MLVFSGSDFAPNVEAFREFKEFCRAEAEFMARSRVYILVVGSVSSEAYRDGALIVTGPVPEVLPYFAASDAGVNLVTPRVRLECKTLRVPGGENDAISVLPAFGS